MQRFQEDILFVDFESLLDSGGGAWWEGWHRLQATALLILDNFGAANPTLEQLQRVQELFHARVRRRKPILFTGEHMRFSDLSAEAPPSHASPTARLLRSLHPSLLHEILDQLKIVQVTGEDFRRKHCRSIPLF
jgi:hypothetical protein